MRGRREWWPGRVLGVAKFAMFRNRPSWTLSLDRGCAHAPANVNVSRGVRKYSPPPASSHNAKPDRRTAHDRLLGWRPRACRALRTACPHGHDTARTRLSARLTDDSLHRGSLRPGSAHTRSTQWTVCDYSRVPRRCGRSRRALSSALPRAHSRHVKQHHLPPSSNGPSRWEQALPGTCACAVHAAPRSCDACIPGLLHRRRAV